MFFVGHNNNNHMLPQLLGLFLKVGFSGLDCSSSSAWTPAELLLTACSLIKASKNGCSVLSYPRVSSSSVYALHKLVSAEFIVGLEESPDFVEQIFVHHTCLSFHFIFRVTVSHLIFKQL